MGHDHDHDPGPKGNERAFIIGIALNLVYTVIAAGYGILAHPRRRLMYDHLLAQQPAPPPTASEARLWALAPWARRLNAALLALCLLLGLDWALPLREYPAVRMALYSRSSSCGSVMVEGVTRGRRPARVCAASLASKAANSLPVAVQCRLSDPPRRMSSEMRWVP